MSQLISLSVTSRDGVATTGIYGFDVEDIVSPIRELSGGAGCYFTARMKRGTTSGHGETLGAIEYRVSETLPQIVALSSNLLLLSVTERRGESLAEDMIFIASRISENIKPVTGGSQFYYHEDGDPLPVDYIVSQSVANIVTQTTFSSCYAMTYAQLTAAMAANELICGTQIRITDRGDQGIIVRAISSNQIDPTGVRLMNVPIDYSPGATIGGLLNRGIYYQGMAVAASDLAIWGGFFWINQTGLVGNPISNIQLDNEWNIVQKPGYGMTNEFYDLRIFNVIYDVANDWIAKQWDDRGNEFGISYQEEVFSAGWGFNWCDHSDWNFWTKSAVSYFYNNKCVGIMNNWCRGIYDNFCQSGPIWNNALVASNLDIYGNNCGGIYNNKCGQIIDNHLIESAYIQDNENTGSIRGNQSFPHEHENNNIQNMPPTIDSVNYNSVYSPGESGLLVDISGTTVADLVSQDVSRWASKIILTSNNATETVQTINNHAFTDFGKKYRFLAKPAGFGSLVVTFQHGIAPNQPRCEGAVNAIIDSATSDWVEFEATNNYIQQSNIGTY